MMARSPLLVALVLVAASCVVQAHIPPWHPKPGCTKTYNESPMGFADDIIRTVGTTYTDYCFTARNYRKADIAAGFCNNVTRVSQVLFNVYRNMSVNARNARVCGENPAAPTACRRLSAVFGDPFTQDVYWLRGVNLGITAWGSGSISICFEVRNTVTLNQFCVRPAGISPNERRPGCAFVLYDGDYQPHPRCCPNEYAFDMDNKW